MSREKAKEILDDNMSECTSHHVQKMDHLEQWIIDAMIEYAQNQAKNNEVLDLVSCLFSAEKVEEAYDDGHYDGQIQRSKTFDIETYS